MLYRGMGLLVCLSRVYQYLSVTDLVKSVPPLFYGFDLMIACDRMDLKERMDMVYLASRSQIGYLHYHNTELAWMLKSSPSFSICRSSICSPSAHFL